MTLPHLDRPICEPVELPPGAPVRVERIRQGREARASTPFVHFHDVCELVLFGKVAGTFSTDECCYMLGPGSIAYVPSLRQHDFALQAGPRDWMLIQLEAGVGDALARAPGLQRLRQPFCACPDRTLRQRLALLADWLAGLEPGDPLARSLVELLLRAVLRATPVEGESLEAGADGLRRLRPAIDQLRRHPAHAPNAAQAAHLCALSQAYFSRRFKQQVGMSWSDYVRTHRLQLASRRLLETDRSIAAIADDLGFSTPSHFGELFHRRFGVTPKGYRQANQDAHEKKRPSPSWPPG